MTPNADSGRGADLGTSEVPRSQNARLIAAARAVLAVWDEESGDTLDDELWNALANLRAALPPEGSP